MIITFAKINFERKGFIWHTGYSPSRRQTKWQLKAGTKAEMMNNWNLLFCLFCLSPHPFNTASDKLPRGATTQWAEPSSVSWKPHVKLMEAIPPQLRVLWPKRLQFVASRLLKLNIAVVKCLTIHFYIFITREFYLLLKE